MIRLKDVEMEYDNGTRAIKGISLTIEDGVLTGITPKDPPPLPEPEPTAEERLNDIEEAIQRGLSL